MYYEVHIWPQYCSALGKHQFVWVGCDKRDHIRKYGHSFRGIPPVSQRLLVRGAGEG